MAGWQANSFLKAAQREFFNRLATQPWQALLLDARPLLLELAGATLHFVGALHLSQLALRDGAPGYPPPLLQSGEPIIKALRGSHTATCANLELPQSLSRRLSRPVSDTSGSWSRGYPVRFGGAPWRTPRFGPRLWQVARVPCG